MALAITSPSDKNITVGDPIDIQWVASGGTASAVFTKRFETTDHETCDSIYIRGTKAVAGFGNGSTADAVMRESNDAGLTWVGTPILSLPSPYKGISAVFITTAGSIIAGSAGNSTTIGIWKNGERKYTGLSKTYVRVYDFKQLPNGKIIAVCGFNTAQILVSSDDGETWLELLSYASGTFTSMILVGNSVLVPLVATNNSTDGVYKTDGVTVARVLTLPQYVVIMRLSATKIMAIELLSPFSAKQTTDDGNSWQTYTGVLPPVTDMDSGQQEFIDGVAYTSNYTGGTIKYTSDVGATWQSITLPVGLERVSMFAVEDRHTIMLGGMVSTGDGDIYEMTPPTIPVYSGQLKIGGVDSGSPVVNTSGAFGYTKAVSELADTNTYTMEVTNISSTVSDSVTVDVNKVFAFIETPVNQSVTYGDMLDLRWVVEGGLSSAYVVELYFNDVIEANYSNLTGIFDFSRASTMDDNGTFRCRVSNGGSFTENEIVVSVASGAISPLLCEQGQSYSGGPWNANVLQTYFGNNSFLDSGNDILVFRGVYIMTNEQLRNLMQFHRVNRGTPFTIDDGSFGVQLMFGYSAGNTTHDVVLTSVEYDRISSVTSRVEVSLMKVRV